MIIVTVEAELTELTIIFVLILKEWYLFDLELILLSGLACVRSPDQDNYYFNDG